MAKHYASNSNVIFESFNELSTTTDSDASAFAAFNSGWINAIESGEGPNNHIKIVQLLYRSSWTYIFLAPYVSGTHANVILATHSYPLVDAPLNIAQEYALAYATAIHGQNLPWIDTEFGTAVNNAQSPPGYTGVSNAVSLMAQYNAVGWGYFCYDSSPYKEGNWNINNPTNAASLLPILQPIMVK
jgi:hypothetical protein